MILSRTLSLFAYFIFFIDIAIYDLESMPWSSIIFGMVGRVVADLPWSFRVHAGWYSGYQSSSRVGRDEAMGVGAWHAREWSVEIQPKVLQGRDFLLPFLFALSPCLIRFDRDRPSRLQDVVTLDGSSI
jgi:hypothetical protein